MGHQMKHDFHAIINCNEDLLGIDLINKYCIGYDPKTGLVYNDTLRTEENMATISSEINLLALSTTVIKARYNRGHLCRTSGHLPQTGRSHCRDRT